MRLYYTRLYTFTTTSGVTAEYTGTDNQKVTFDGKDYYASGATIEVTSGEITFNADTSTFGSLDSGDKFKVGNTEYTVGENCILQSGKVWLNPSTVTIDELKTENNWTAAVDGTITLSATSETIYFYGTDGKEVAKFDDSTLTKENDSSTAITAIDASALTSAITINGFYNENTTITAGSGGVNVNVGGNKFSVFNGAFKFDGSKLIDGTATLSTVNDAVKVGDNFITLTVGDGITVNASDLTIGGLNSGDKFTIGKDSYEVADNGIIKNNSAIHAIAESLAISSDDWTAATIIADNAITLGNDTTYVDSTAKKIAKLENNTLTAIDTTEAANLTVDVGTGTEYTLGKEFINLKSGDNSFKITATDDYKVNGTTITLANVTGVEIGSVNYSVDTEKISKTLSGNTYHLTKSDTVTTSALTGDDNWKLYSGTVTVNDSLTTTNGKTLIVAGDSDGVEVTVADGAITLITGLVSGGSVTYDDKTYTHTINLPSSATAMGDKLVIDGKDYYATGTTVTISGFTGGEISFDSSITNLAESGDSIIAKVGEDVALTISSLTYPTENGNDWTVSGNSASYLKKFTAGAIISDKKITYKAENNETLATVTGVKSLNGVSLNGKVVTVSNSALNQGTVTISDGYTLKLADDVTAPVETKAGWSKLSSGKATYNFDSTTAGYSLANNKVSYTKAVAAKSFTLSGIKSTSGIKVDGSTVTISAGFTLKLANGVTVPTALAPTWTVNDTNATLHSNMSAGYSLENNNIVYNAKKTGDAQITLGGLIKNAKLALPEKNTLTLAASVLGTNTSIESNAGGYTIKLTGDMKGKKFIGTSNSDTLSIAAENASVEGDKGNDKLIGSANNDSLNGGSGNDTLSGGSGKDKLYGGAGKDTLWGGTGNDTLYGGDGSDIFIYKPNEGNDKIMDYNSGDMLQILKSDGSAGGSFTKYSFSNNKLTLTIDGGGSVVFDGVKSGDSFNINSTIHTLSGKKLK